MSKLSKTSNIALRIAIFASLVLVIVLIMQAVGLYSDVVSDVANVFSATNDIGSSDKLTAAQQTELITEFGTFTQVHADKFNLLATLSIVSVAVSAIAAILSWVAFKATKLGASIARGIFLLVNLFFAFNAYSFNSAAKWCTSFTGSTISNETIAKWADEIVKAFAKNNVTVDTANAISIAGSLVGCMAMLFAFISAVILIVLTITSIVNIVKASKAN